LVSDYPWYQITEDLDLLQGDMIRNCPILVPPPDLGPEVGAAPMDVTFQTYNVVVMSQSCDLVQGKVSLVLVCPHWTVTDFKEQNPDLATPKNLERIRRGNLPAYHMLAACNDFRNVYSVHISSLKAHVARNPRRLRLLPPYREHLSQAFARFFMRVGLPVDIPRFT